jgi:hypothetical protein
LTNGPLPADRLTRMLILGTYYNRQGKMFLVYIDGSKARGKIWAGSFAGYNHAISLLLYRHGAFIDQEFCYIISDLQSEVAYTIMEMISAFYHMGMKYSHY